MSGFGLELWNKAFDTPEKKRDLRGLKRDLQLYSQRLKGNPETLAGIKYQCPLLSQKIKMVLDEFGNTYPSEKHPETEMHQALKADLQNGLYFFLTSETVTAQELQPPRMHEYGQIVSFEVSANTQFMSPDEKEEKSWRDYYTLRFPFISFEEEGVGDHRFYYVNAPDNEENQNLFGYDLQQYSEKVFCTHFSAALSEFLEMVVAFLDEQGI